MSKVETPAVDIAYYTLVIAVGSVGMTLRSPVWLRTASSWIPPRKRRAFGKTSECDISQTTASRFEHRYVSSLSGAARPELS